MATREEWKTLSSTLYTVGWIAALPLERAAALLMLDERHNKPKDFVPNRIDNNSYSWGRIGIHNVVITSLPVAEYGKVSAAGTAIGLLSSLPHIRVGLLVGIGAGVPAQDNILLGDVVVSSSDHSDGGVVQYDLYKAKREDNVSTKELKGFLNGPPRVLRAALSALRAEHEIGDSLLPELMKVFENNEKTKLPYGFPGIHKDHLRRDTDNARLWPKIHYGTIASGDILIKDKSTRDDLISWLHNNNIVPLCFEMEAAGLMNNFPCLVIRGICDYADELKTDDWQRYAAATAAAFAKELLSYIDNAEVEITTKIGDLIGVVHEIQKDIKEDLNVFRTDIIAGQEYSVLQTGLVAAHGAIYNARQDEHSSYCLDGTREELLSQVNTWIDDPSRGGIFWLWGKAGTGKSTIARTVARSMDRSGRLGATFFFKRGVQQRSDASRFVSTIVRQLLDQVPAAAKAVALALKADSFLSQRDLQQQFDELLFRPFSALSVEQVPLLTPVIVIDALDECESSADVSKILRCLSQALTIGFFRLRFFLTSRPEVEVQLSFQHIKEKTHQEFALDRVRTRTVAHDLRVYFQYELERIRESALVRDHESLPKDWPSDDDVQALVDLAVPLFIFAFTACRYISFRNPEERLKVILRQRHNPALSGLSRTYLPILKQMVLEENMTPRKQVIEEFRNIVGPIVLLVEPLSAIALSSLLGIPTRLVRSILAKLQSVLDVSYDAPIRLLHISFRDFLTNVNGSEADEFHIKEQETHAKLADCCLHHLQKPNVLRRDMCQVSHWGIRRSAVSQQHVMGSVPPETAYACSYWVFHLLHDASQPSCLISAFEFLRLHFLHWLETLSWLGKIATAIQSLSELKSYIKNDDHTELSAFLEDSLRFVQKNHHLLDLAPLQLYHSALIFAPNNSIVRATFLSEEHEAFSIYAYGNSDWNPELLRLEGHKDTINMVAFSPDGEFLASASADSTVRVWNVTTGQQVQLLRGHTRSVYAIDFSADGKLLASASEDETARIWHLRTGEGRHILEGHSDYVLAVRFTHLNGDQVATASRDGTVRLWDMITGTETQLIKMSCGYPEMMSFSTDGQLIAIVSHDRLIHLCDTKTGQETSRLKGNIRFNRSIAISPNNQLLASTLPNDPGIDLFDTSIEKVHNYHSTSGIMIDTVAFSSDSKLVALGNTKREIGLWQIDPWKQQRLLTGYTRETTTLAFSPNDTMLASASADKTVRLWNISKKVDLSETTQTSPMVKIISFSVGAQFLAITFGSDCSKGKIFVFNGSTGKMNCILKHDLLAPIKIAFSTCDVNLLASSQKSAIYLWNISEQQIVHNLEGHSGLVTKIDFNPDGSLLASASSDTTIILWGMDTFQQVLKLDSHYSHVWDVSFSPCGRLLASTSNDSIAVGLEGIGADDESVRVWDVKTGQEVQKFGLFSWSVRFSEDGRGLITDRGLLPLDPALLLMEHQTRLSLISMHDSWIQWKGQDVLWLPYEHRTGPIAYSGNRIAFGYTLKTFSLLEIRINEG